MRFLLLLTEDDPAAWGRAGEVERQQVYERHAAFDAAVRERGTLVAGEALTGQDTARTLRTVAGARVVTQGPYAETVEQLGGVYLVDVPDLDTALELSRILPDGYTIEVRAVVVMDGYDY